MKIDDLTLEKFLGKGAFGEVHLTKLAGDDKYYATKVYDREKVEPTPAMKYLKNEISIMHSLDHPNIIKLIKVKKTKKHFYIVTEFANGGDIEGLLAKYQEKHGKPFSEEIVQYLMRQIISAFQYMHSKNIMHRDIKLENILVNFDNEEDKQNLNIMKAVVKIIDFGFACKIEKNALTYTAVGSYLNMDPMILKKLTCHGKVRELGYDMKADIWSLGTICYQMLIGKAAFDADDLDDLVSKVEKGKYKVPTTLSREVVAFLNGMLQYEANLRLTADQLSNHPFLTTEVKNFHKIDLKQVSGKVNDGEIEIITKKEKNQTIWAIFNKEDEKKLMNIGQLETIPEEEPKIQNQKSLNPEQMQKNQMSAQPPIKSANTFETENYPNIQNLNINDNGYSFNSNNQYNGPVFPRNMQGIPGNHYDPSKFTEEPPSSQTMNETDYNFSGSIYG